MILVAAGACAPGAEGDPSGGAITPTYNEETGRLELLTYDSNDNGQIDTWTYMDRTRVMRTEIDADGVGLIDRSALPTNGRRSRTVVWPQSPSMKIWMGAQTDD